MTSCSMQQQICYYSMQAGSLCPAPAAPVTADSGLKMRYLLLFLKAGEQQGLTF